MAEVNYFGTQLAPPVSSPSGGPSKNPVVLVLIVGVMLGICGFIVYRQIQAEEAIKAQARLALELSTNERTLHNYLFSGDPGEIESLKQRRLRIHSLIAAMSSSTSEPALKQELRELASHEDEWNSKFAEPLITKRKEVDAGKVRLAELQIFYLQQDPSQWSDSISVPQRWFFEPF